MTQKIRSSLTLMVPAILAATLLVLLVAVHPASAIERIPNPAPQPGSYGLEAVKPKDPPTVGATINTPANGASFSTSPVTVNGICPDGLLVEIYNNGVMVGSVMCEGGSFSLQISLFAGLNELTAIVYDDLEQAGPTSNIATINYTDTRFTAFGQLVTLTSQYGRRSAAATTELTWPIQISGGAGPYALSIDWGDGTPSELRSQAVSGALNIAHTFKKAGIYQVNIKVTDSNGVTAFLQVIAVASGKVDVQPAATVASGPPQVLWVPAAAAVILLLPAFLLGRMSQTVSIRNRMLKERDSFEKEANAQEVWKSPTEKA